MMGQGREQSGPAELVSSRTWHHAAPAVMRIPVMRPRLPEAVDILPYLEQIDATRLYSNFGPLLRTFEARLAEHLAVGTDQLVCVSSGTAALTLSLRAFAAKPGSRCAMPAWTFVASAHAACEAGLTPWFLDVDADTWALDPDAVATAVAASPEPVGAILVVAPFGATLDTAAWDRLGRKLGIPVVIDAAAGFDAVNIGAAPVIVSLHATKPIGMGEGGLVASTDAALIDLIRRQSNFGFRGTREALSLGTNAKLSEYGAAVGLAALDAWPETRRAYAELAKRYSDRLAGLAGVTWQPALRQGHLTSTLNLDLGRPCAVAVQDLFAAQGIGTRRWWSGGCHVEAAFRDFPREDLPETERLAASVIGLPFYPDLPPAGVDEVCAAVVAALSTDIAA